MQFSLTDRYIFDYFI